MSTQDSHQARAANDKQTAVDWIHQGDQLLKESKLAEAIVAYEKAVQLKPDSAAFQYKLGHALLQQNELEKAEACFRLAVELDDQFHWGHYGLAQVASRLEQWEQAEALYRRVIELKPDFFYAYQELGFTWSKRSEWRDAIKAFQKAIEINSSLYWSYYGMGISLENLGELSKAIDFYEKAIELKPECPEAKNKLCSATEAYNKKQKIDWLYTNSGVAKGSLELHEEPWKIPSILAEVIANRGSLDDSIIAYNYAVDLYPDYFEACFRLGTLLKEAKQLREALQVFLRAFQLNSNYYEVHLHIGEIYRSLQQWREALCYYERAFRIVPNNHYARSALQELLEKLRRNISLRKAESSISRTEYSEFVDLEFIEHRSSENSPNVYFEEPKGNTDEYCQLANKVFNMAIYLWSRGQYKNALELHREAIYLDIDYCHRILEHEVEKHKNAFTPSDLTSSILANNRLKKTIDISSVTLALIIETDNLEQLCAIIKPFCGLTYRVDVTQFLLLNSSKNQLIEDHLNQFAKSCCRNTKILNLFEKEENMYSLLTAEQSDLYIFFSDRSFIEDLSTIDDIKKIFSATNNVGGGILGAFRYSLHYSVNLLEIDECKNLSNITPTINVCHILRYQHIQEKVIELDRVNSFADISDQMVKFYHQGKYLQLDSCGKISNLTNYNFSELGHLIGNRTVENIRIRTQKINTSITPFPFLIKAHKRLVEKWSLGVRSKDINGWVIGGGCFNPSTIKYKQGYAVIFRAEPSYNAWSGKYVDYWKSPVYPILAIYENSLDEVPKCYELQKVGFPDISRLEDFRFFTCQGKLLVSHVVFKPNPLHSLKEEITFENENLFGPRVLVEQVISEVDVKLKQLILFEVPRLPQCNHFRGIDFIEKNWVYFNHKNVLHMIYTINPWVVFKKADNEWILSMHENLDILWDEPSDVPKFHLCLSAAPIRLTNEWYLLFFHTKKENYQYAQGAILIDSKTLIPRRITHNAIFIAEGLDGHYPNVVYITSAFIEGDSIIISYGEADSHCSCIELDKELLTRFLLENTKEIFHSDISHVEEA